MKSRPGRAPWRWKDATPITADKNRPISIRKLRRYFSAHPDRIPVPTEKARKRHKRVAK